MYGQTVDDVMAIKPRFLASMGYTNFLNNGTPRARGAPLIYRDYFMESARVRDFHTSTLVNYLKSNE